MWKDQLIWQPEKKEKELKKKKKKRLMQETV